jgi:hypothetical protein
VRYCWYELGRIKLQCNSPRKWSDQTTARARGGALQGKFSNFHFLICMLGDDWCTIHRVGFTDVSVCHMCVCVYTHTHKHTTRTGCTLVALYCTYCTLEQQRIDTNKYLYTDPSRAHETRGRKRQVCSRASKWALERGSCRGSSYRGYRPGKTSPSTCRANFRFLVFESSTNFLTRASLPNLHGRMTT